MRILIALLVMYVALVIFGQTAMAVTLQNVKPLKTTPPILSSNTSSNNLARIVDEWEIDEFRRDDGFPTGECVMQANYDNDLEITFKAKNGQLSAVRIRDLERGNSERVSGFSSLGLGKSFYGLQSRSKPGQIDASLLTVPAPAEKIMDLGRYDLKIGKQTFKFDAGEFAYGYHDLVTCTGYEDAKTLKVVNHPRSGLRPIKKNVAVPTLPAEPIDLVEQFEVVDTPMLPQVAIEKAPVVDTPSNDISADMQTWNAYKGDLVSQVLKDWSNQAGVASNIDLQNDVKLTSDFRAFGTLDIAVAELLKQSMGDNLPVAMLQGHTKSDVTKISGFDKQGNVLASKASTSAPINLSDNNWRALKGADLRKLLKRWSVKEGVGFVWNADQTFLVKDTMKSVTSYDAAVSELLSQYSGQDVKPVGTLNVDPKTKSKTLIISVSGNS